MRLCRASVMHARLFPVRYRFVYRVFSLLLDIDRIDEDARARRWFSHNRFNLLSFHDRDHGPRDGSSLRAWAEATLREHAGLELAGGRIRLLCFPRVLGYGFNPLSVWFCEHRHRGLVAVLCEVHNTFGESHTYVLARQPGAPAGRMRAEKPKRFHVSPFIAMDARYRFRIDIDDRRVRIAIRESQHGRHLLSASYDGALAAADDAALVASALAVPLLGIKVMALIHWQALLIWLKGAPYIRKPAPPAEEAS